MRASRPHQRLLSLLLKQAWQWACALSLLAVTHLHAGGISFSNVPGNVLLKSSGVTALDDVFIFEIGAFNTGFNPTVSNLLDWQANWKPFDRALAPAGNGWNSSLSYFTSSAFLESSGMSDQGLSSDVFAAGDQAYLWVYNSQAVDPTSEWALLTNDSNDGSSLDNWAFSDPLDALAPTVSFYLSTATNPVFGGANNVQGGGDFTAPLTAFQLQTHVVPEPTGALLLLIAGILVRIQRARALR